MAIGGSFNSNTSNGTSEGKTNKVWDSEYFSRFKIRNAEQRKQLSASFKSGLLILSIDKLEENFTATTLQKIYLSPTKALLLAHELDAFVEYLKSNEVEAGRGFGVNAGMGEKVTYIALHAARGTKYITIGKFDNAGNIIEKETLELNNDYHYALEWEDVEANKVERNIYNDIELEMFKTFLVDFAHSMNGAIGYSVADTAKYDLRKVLNKMDPIYDKLGIERRFNNGYSSGDSKPNNFLSNLGSKSSNTISLEDIGDELMDE